MTSWLNLERIAKKKRKSWMNVLKLKVQEKNVCTKEETLENVLRNTKNSNHAKKKIQRRQQKRLDCSRYKS